MRSGRRYTQEEFDRYAAGHLNRCYVIPIIEDHAMEILPIGDPPLATIGPPPDRMVGVRIYAQQDGRKMILETRSDDKSDYNIFKMHLRDWDEDEVLRSHIDSNDRLES